MFTLTWLKWLKKLAQVINNMGFQWIVLTEHHATIVGFPTARRIVWLNNTLLFYVFLTASFEIMQKRFEVYCPKLFTLPGIWGAPFLGPDHKFRIGLVGTDCIKRWWYHNNWSHCDTISHKPIVVDTSVLIISDGHSIQLLHNKNKHLQTPFCCLTWFSSFDWSSSK